METAASTSSSFVLRVIDPDGQNQMYAGDQELLSLHGYPSGKIRCPSQTEHHHLIERQEHMQINGKLLRGETLQTCF